jgi:hypothetical protein
MAANSNLIKKPIAEATDSELAYFANTVLGLGVPENSTRSALLAAIEATGQHKTVECPKPTKAASRRAETAAKTSNAEDDRSFDPDDEYDPMEHDLIELYLQPVQERGGDRPYPFSVNGRTMLIPRGRNVLVKRKYLEILDNAKVKVTDVDQNGLPTGQREVHAHAFTVRREYPDGIRQGMEMGEVA